MKLEHGKTLTASSSAQGDSSRGNHYQEINFSVEVTPVEWNESLLPYRMPGDEYWGLGDVRARLPKGCNFYVRVHRMAALSTDQREGKTVVFSWTYHSKRKAEAWTSDYMLERVSQSLRLPTQLSLAEIEKACLEAVEAQLVRASAHKLAEDIAFLSRYFALALARSARAKAEELIEYQSRLKWLQNKRAAAAIAQLRRRKLHSEVREALSNSEGKREEVILGDDNVLEVLMGEIYRLLEEGNMGYRALTEDSPPLGIGRDPSAYSQEDLDALRDKIEALEGT